MHEVLLQSIVEKLQSIEILLKQDNGGKSEQSIKCLHEEINKISVSALSIDKFNELKLGIDECYKKIDRPSQRQIEHKHYLHKGLWISFALFFASVFLLWQWINTANTKKQFQANDIKYRALKVAGDTALLKILYHADSLYEFDPDRMEHWVIEEENRFIQEIKMHRLADEKKKDMKPSKNKVENK